MGSKFNDKSFLRQTPREEGTHRGQGNVKAEVENGVVWPQAKEAKRCWALLEGARGKE